MGGVLFGFGLLVLSGCGGLVVGWGVLYDALLCEVFFVCVVCFGGKLGCFMASTVVSLTCGAGLLGGAIRLICNRVYFYIIRV